MSIKQWEKTNRPEDLEATKQENIQANRLTAKNQDTDKESHRCSNVTNGCISSKDIVKDKIFVFNVLY